jgi:type III secretory pathway lipoprotein EscJ
VSPAQVIACGIVAASIGWSFWLLRDRPLSDEVELLPGTVLPYTEMAVVEAALDKAQLTDHRTDDGRIWVPRSRHGTYQRALVEAQALPQRFGSSLHRVLEKNSPWQSTKSQQQAYRVAIQDELKQVICAMPGIEDASVLYDEEQRTGLEGGVASTVVRTASVNVRTRPDAELEPQRVQAIRVSVAAAIAGLSADRVAVIDLRTGQHHSGPVSAAAADVAAADPELARRIAHEKHLAAKVRHGIGFVKGAIVNVTVGFAAPAAPPASAAPPVRQQSAAANAPARRDAAGGRGGRARRTALGRGRDRHPGGALSGRTAGRAGPRSTGRPRCLRPAGRGPHPRCRAPAASRRTARRPLPDRRHADSRRRRSGGPTRASGHVGRDAAAAGRRPANAR